MVKNSNGHANGAAANHHHPSDSGEGPSQGNIIKSFNERHFDSESYAKLQHVLEFVTEPVYTALYEQYNANLLANLTQMQHEQPPIEPSLLASYPALKAKFYSFRFITDIDKITLLKPAKPDDSKKADDMFVSLTKILLFHALISKDVSANLALVELEQLCARRNLTLNKLYYKYRAKFLKLIIRAILTKLMESRDQSQPATANNWGNNCVNGNGSAKTNCVIKHMTRALEVFNVATITSEDVAQSLIITTNLINKDNIHKDAIKMFLEYLARYQNIDITTLIKSHIQAIVVSLLLKKKMSHFDMTASLTGLCSFCDKTPREMLDTKFTFIKSRLLLHYSIDAKTVTEGIYYLSKFEKTEYEQPFEDEFDDDQHFMDYLNPDLVGIFLGVDAHFTANKKDLGSEESIKHLHSLCQLLTKLSETQVQTIHVKLLSTLSLLIRLRPRRDNQSLNIALRDLWREFVSKLDDDLRASLLINICVALYELMEDCPDDVSGIYFELICKGKPSMIDDHLKSLFFIPNIPAMKKVYDRLTPHVRRSDTVADLQELQQSIDYVLPLLKLESQRCRTIALTKIKRLLQTNQGLLVTKMLTNLDEPLDGLISKTIQSLIGLSSTQGAEYSSLVAECLGILGAINPIRLDHLIYGEISDKSTIVTELHSPKFVAELIERLKNSLFSDQRSESEIASYALQVAVKSFPVFENKDIKSRLSGEAIKACTLCRNTNYSVAQKASPDTSQAAYELMKADKQHSYRDWLDKFSLNIMGSLNDKILKEVLIACTYLFKYNLKLAEFLLPNVVLYMIGIASDKLKYVRKEICSIMEENVGLSTQDLDSVYSDDVRGGLQALHVQCANMVFCIMDAIERLDHCLKQTDESIKPKIQSPVVVKKMIDAIPKDSLAILASRCRSNTRALRYFEEFLSHAHNQDKFDRHATSLQKIYVGLGDTFEAAGIEMVRISPTTLVDDIANYEACGRYDRAFICCTTSFDGQTNSSDRESLIEDSLQCLSKQGDYHRLLEKSKQFIRDFPQFKRDLLPYAIEAEWKLGRWDDLSSTFRTEQIDSLLETSSVSQGLLLTCVNSDARCIAVPESLNIVRRRLMKPLSIAMMDRSAYFRGYQSLLVLHSIEDFATASRIFEDNQFDMDKIDENTVDVMRATITKHLDGIFDLWSKRNKLVEPSLKSLEPLLAWQRSICMTMSERFPFMSNKIGVDIGQSWLTSAESAREARSFDRSFFCLVQSQRWFGSDLDKLDLNLKVKYHIEQAKLDWDQGDQTKAIRSLKLSIKRLKNHGLYKHLQQRKSEVSTNDPFPKLNNLITCDVCNEFKLEDRESFAKLKTLLTHYCEEAAAEIPETLFFMYEECVHLGVNQEETYFRLARYYDRLLAYYQENPQLCSAAVDDRNQLDTQRFSQNLMTGDNEEVFTKLMEHSIIAFGNSLKYGVRYLRESMPRLLNIWYDLGTRKNKSASRLISSRIENTVRFIDELKTKHLPPYYFMTAISILLSRVLHPHSGVSKKTCEILELLLSRYPHQLSWQMIAILHDTANNDRRRVSNQIIQNVKKKGQHVEKVLNHTLAFAKILNAICYNMSPHDRNAKKKKLTGDVDMTEICPEASRMDFTSLEVMAPVQASIRAIIPMDNACGNLEEHVVFPAHNIMFIRKFSPKVRVFNSLQQPKAVGLICHNGKTVNILCKQGDDLRKDSRCVEFLNLLNRILKRDSQSNARFFEIQTFLVLPIQHNSGIIEMVPNCISLKSIVEPLYKQRKPNFQIQEQPPKRAYARELSVTDAYNLFTKVSLPKAKPAVLPGWFMTKFTEPTSWYMARLAFVRTTAVVSMGGYIIGLGDRHLDNILVDTTNGGLVHVDFNLLFHQGETLGIPERVPFRLTQNMVATFGSLGTEGNFRKVCEIAMRVMRKEKDALLTTLKPFMHDPCSDWTKQRDPGKGNRADMEDKHAENKSAKYRIEVTERKLKGFPRSKFKPLTLIDSYSVEAQVDSLIQEARDPYNLSLMYFGWCPHI